MTCNNPFEYLEVHGRDRAFMCCPSWLPVQLSMDNIKKEWNSSKVIKARKSALEGHYRECTEHCPLLKLHGRKNSCEGERELYSPGPSRVKFCFDRECNLYCTSCRPKLETCSPEQRSENRAIIEKLESIFGETITRVDLSGSGDPFFSKTLREWLKSVSKERYPKLDYIHLHTNALLWTPKMWKEIENAVPYIKSAEISIDAATKNTYESIRRGGKWETLQENLKFIDTLGLEFVTLSFVVQEGNYTELEAFYEMAASNFKQTKFFVRYAQILDWGVPDFPKLNCFSDPEKVRVIKEQVKALEEKYSNVYSDI